MTSTDHGPGVRLPPPVLVGGVLAVAELRHAGAVSGDWPDRLVALDPGAGGQ
ncbi:MAG: hypothetical protein LW713_02905 [Acetobacteraceae bacterium]|nr:hypothetical protein [Acetobacteraceae bacterium]